MDKEIKSDEEITDLELEIKIEKSDEKVNIKTEVTEETINSKLIQIIGEKRHFNVEISNLENKRIKEEFVVFEEFDYKKEPQKITDIIFDDLNNQVILIIIFLR
jgi:macrodomain Ter protein organizer (MatP/YcbG family)